MAEKKNGLAHRLYTGQLSYDFVKGRKLWFTVSAILLIVSILAILFRGLSLGIEFQGGTDFQVPMQVTSTTVDDVRAKVEAFDIKDLGESVFSLGDSAIRIQTRSLNPAETTSVKESIANMAGVSEDLVTYNAIGASWGQQISRQGIIALVVFIVLVMLLIWVWFRDWKMSVAAVLALAHDLVVTVGLYALVGFTVTPATLIGVLTILGYSLYDTVVVFDKIKENVENLAESRMTYSHAANLAVNQVLIRSINTTVIGVLPVAALLIAGAALNSGPLEDLGLSLFIGMIAGAYSSIFIATPILCILKEREPKMVAHRAALARRIERAESKATKKAELAARTGGGTSVALAEAGEDLDESVVEVADDAAASSGPRQQRRSNLSRAERKKR